MAEKCLKAKKRESVRRQIAVNLTTRDVEMEFIVCVCVDGGVLVCVRGRF